MPKYIEVETKACPECGQSTFLTIPKSGYDSWKAGTFIQIALPILSDDEREMLITGYHDECWEKLTRDFKDD